MTDFSNVPPIDLSRLKPEDVEAAFAPLDPAESEALVKRIQEATRSNENAKAQLATVLALLNAVVKISLVV